MTEHQEIHRRVDELVLGGLALAFTHAGKTERIKRAGVGVVVLVEVSRV